MASDRQQSLADCCRLPPCPGTICENRRNLRTNNDETDPQITQIPQIDRIARWHQIASRVWLTVADSRHVPAQSAKIDEICGQITAKLIRRLRRLHRLIEWPAGIGPPVVSVRCFRIPPCRGTIRVICVICGSTGGSRPPGCDREDAASRRARPPGRATAPPSPAPAVTQRCWSASPPRATGA